MTMCRICTSNVRCGSSEQSSEIMSDLDNIHYVVPLMWSLGYRPIFCQMDADDRHNTGMFCGSVNQLAVSEVAGEELLLQLSLLYM